MTLRVGEPPLPSTLEGLCRVCACLIPCRAESCTGAAAGASAASGPAQCPRSPSISARRRPHSQLLSFFTSLPYCNLLMSVFRITRECMNSGSPEEDVPHSAGTTSVPIISVFCVGSFACSPSCQNRTTTGINCDHRVISPHVRHLNIHRPSPLPLPCRAQFLPRFCFTTLPTIASVPALTALGPAPTLWPQ
jgi:hypothetical protein